MTGSEIVGEQDVGQKNGGTMRDNAATGIAMDSCALQRYVERMESLPGWFLPDAALMFMAYNQLIAEQGLAGNTLEIGVYHGKSAVAVASLRGESGTFTAIDVFDDLQSRDGSSRDVGMKGAFLATMAASFPTLEWARTIHAPSSTVRADALGPHTFCHIDGLHSAEGTYADLRLCADVVVPGGLVALDDYFNQQFPGVCEGALSFERRHPSVLIPIAVGFNKVLFQRAPESDLNERFGREFSYLPTNVTTMWGRPRVVVRVPNRVVNRPRAIDAAATGCPTGSRAADARHHRAWNRSRPGGTRRGGHDSSARRERNDGRFRMDDRPVVPRVLLGRTTAQVGQPAERVSSGTFARR